jgi:hypothetical protein
VNRNVCRLAGLKVNREVGRLAGLKVGMLREPRGLKDAPSPVFFVSVASKGFSFRVSPLQSTLMSIVASVADKGLKGRGS